MVAVVDGQLSAGDKLAAASTGQQYDILEVGVTVGFVTWCMCNVGVRWATLIHLSIVKQLGVTAQTHVAVAVACVHPPSHTHPHLCKTQVGVLAPEPHATGKLLTGQVSLKDVDVCVCMYVHAHVTAVC